MFAPVAATPKSERSTSGLSGQKAFATSASPLSVSNSFFAPGDFLASMETRETIPTVPANFGKPVLSCSSGACEENSVPIQLAQEWLAAVIPHVKLEDFTDQGGFDAKMADIVKGFQGRQCGWV